MTKMRIITRGRRNKRRVVLVEVRRIPKGKTLHIITEYWVLRVYIYVYIFTCIYLRVYIPYIYTKISLSLKGNIHHVNTKVCVCNVTTLHSPPPAMLHQDFFKKRVPVYMPRSKSIEH